MNEGRDDDVESSVSRRKDRTWTCKDSRIIEDQTGTEGRGEITSQLRSCVHSSVT